MMEKTENKIKQIPRIGDTGARSQNQVGFYTTMLKGISLIGKKEEKAYRDAFYEWINDNTSINYKKDDRINRIQIIEKVLRELKLIRLNKGIYELRKTARDFLEEKLLKNNHSLKNQAGILFWQWAILNWKRETEENYPFREIILEIYTCKQTDARILYDKFVNWHLSMIKPREIREKEFTVKNIKSFINARKPSKSVIYDTLEQMGRMLMSMEKEIDTILYSNSRLKGSYARHFLKYLFEYKNNADLKKKISLQKINNKELWSALDRSWIHSLLTDYLDLNIRWLTETAFFKVAKTKNNKLLYVNEKQKFRECLIKCLRKETGYMTFETYMSYFGHVQEIKEVPNSFPCNLDTACKCLEEYTEDNENRKTIDENFGKGIDTPTVIEYLVNLIFAHVLGVTTNEFEECCKTNLEANLMPIYHAPKGRSDGVFVLDGQKLQLLVETTLLDNDTGILKNEWEPCKRHYCNLEGEKKILFLIVKKAEENIIHSFLHKENCVYFDNDKNRIECKILVLTFSELIQIAKKKQTKKNLNEYYGLFLKKLKDIYNELPFSFNDRIMMKEKRKELVNSLMF